MEHICDPELKVEQGDTTGLVRMFDFEFYEYVGVIEDLVYLNGHVPWRM